MVSRIWPWTLLISILVLAAQAQEQRTPLAEIPVAGGDLRYEVAAGNCVQRECPVVVLLLGGSHTFDHRALEKSSSSSNFTKRVAKREDGVGDPAHLNASVTVWGSGDEDDDATVLAVRPFRLTRDFTGILIDQRTGFEHVKRWHTLLAAKDNKLIELWKGSEGAGPTYSTAAVIETPDGRQALLFYSVFFYPGDEAPDKLHIEALVYDAGRGRMAPYNSEMSIVRLGPYPSVAEARGARSACKSSGVSLWVLPAKGFPHGRDDEYVLVTVASTRVAGRAAEAELRKCLPSAKLSLFGLKRDSFSLW